jgi:basic amino acid/polyamine antiporter, APA family
VFNAIVGSGIFGLPAVVLALVGGASPLTVLAAGAGIAVIVLCFGEVSSRFRGAGGPYLYAREAFGSFVGLQVGWVSWLVRVASAAANANLFTVYLGALWEPAAGTIGRLAVCSALVWGLTFVNIRGVRQGGRLSTFFAVAKLLPLLVLAVVGLVSLRPEAFAVGPIGGWDQWSHAILLLVFAYGGFEAAMIPMGEARDPQRDAPFALLAGLGVVTLLYVAIQVVVVSTLAGTSNTEQPLAAAAQLLLGPAGVWLLSIGALVSIYGWYSGALLTAPRLTFALAERGDFPRVFAAVHPRFRTPWISILVFGCLSWALALAGSFAYNAELSAVSRLATYATTCAALVVLRRRHAAPAPFRAPFGVGLALLGIGFCAVLMARMGRAELVVLAITVLAATATWLWSRRRTVSTPPPGA